MRRWIMMLAALGSLAGCATLGLNDPQGGAKLSFRALDAGDAGGAMLDGVMYRQGERIRLDMKDPTEGDFTIIASKESLTLIGTDNGEKFAVKMPIEAADELPMKELLDPVAADARDVGACSVAGENGRLHEQTGNGETIRLCTTADKLILRIEEDGRATWETTAIQRARQPESLFEIPTGVETIDLSTLGRDAPRKP